MFGFNKGKLIFLLFALAFVIAVPLTIYQTQQQQDLLQRAENETIYTISSSITVNNKILSVVLALDNKQSLDITAIDMNISYPSELKGLITLEPSLSEVIANKKSNNTIRIVAINSSDQEKKNNLNLGTLTINASTITAQAQINKIAAITITMEIASHNPDSIHNIGINPIKTSDLAQLIAGFGTTGCSLSFDWESDTTLASDTNAYYITVKGDKFLADSKLVPKDQKSIMLPDATANTTYNIDIYDDRGKRLSIKQQSACFGAPGSPTITPAPVNGSIPTPTIPGSAAPTPTDTPPINTPTPLPGSVVLDLNIFLPNMIGKKNDENKDPINKNKNKPIKVILKSPTGTPINKSGTIKYSEDDGKYIGSIDLGKSFPDGTYKILVKKGEFLKGFVKEISIPVSSLSTINIIINVDLLVGLDDDGNPSILYYNYLHSCFGTIISKPKCSDPEDADLNSDGSVNGIDFNIFIRSLKKLLGL